MDFEEILARLDAAIREHGWAVQSVLPGPDNPSFSYTLGLTESFGHAELIMVGFRPELMHRLLNDVGELVRAGERFGDWDKSDKVISGYPVVFRELAPEAAREWAKAARNRNGDRLTVLQVFLPDAAGRFPWDDGCDAGFASQAFLGYAERRPS